MILRQPQDSPDGQGTAQGLSKLGWSKEAVKTYLWGNSKVAASKMNRVVRAYTTQDPMPISASPRGIKIVVAGGLQSGHLMWLQVGCSRPTAAECRDKVTGQIGVSY